MLRAVVVAAVVACGLGAALNVSSVPSTFTSAKHAQMFRIRGWKADNRRCDLLIFSRKMDDSCMKRPSEAEVLPLLVTGPSFHLRLRLHDGAVGTSGVGTRRMADVLNRMGIYVGHEKYASQATVSWTHAVNDHVFAVPYPFSSERTKWWTERAISNRVDYENTMKPRFGYVLHLVRCPMKVIASMMSATAPVLRFVEAVTADPPITSKCAERYACDAGWEARLGWAVSTFVAWNLHIDRYADERLRVEDALTSNLEPLGERLCQIAFANKLWKPNHCDARARRLANLTAHVEKKRVLPSRADLDKAVWPAGVDGPATLRALERMNAAYGYGPECLGTTAPAPAVKWLPHRNRLVEHTEFEAHQRKRLRIEADAGLHTKAGIEQCLVNDDAAACSPFDACPALQPPPRDCLGARVLFGTEYSVIKCCFKCCLHYWLSERTRLGANIEANVGRRGEADGTKPNPDGGDFGTDPMQNLLVHPHAYAAISDVHVHPAKGCHAARDLSDLDVVLVSSYHVDPSKVLDVNAPDPFQRGVESASCVSKLRALPESKPLIFDFFHPAKYHVDEALLRRSKLVTANNVANAPAGADFGLYGKVRERVIGVRGVSLWQAVLEHPDVSQVPRDERLLLCCCMNVDSKHVGRMEHTKILARHHEFRCPVSEKYTGHHIHSPLGDPGSHEIEAEVILMLNNRYGNSKGMKGNYDAHMPVNMLGSKFVFSPNGIGEQCYREYEALISGAIPLVDDTVYAARRNLLAKLPVLLVKNWTDVTPQFLERKHREMMQQSFDVSSLYMPHWYDVILSAMGL